MKVELARGTDRFDDLQFGDTFIFDGNLFMKISANSWNTWNFTANEVVYFSTNPLVKKVNCKIVQID